MRIVTTVAILTSNDRFITKVVNTAANVITVLLPFRVFSYVQSECKRTFY
jgi:hypothetical protein